MSDYSKNYSEDSFWKKIKGSAQKAGLSVVYVGLLLFYTLQKDKDDVPFWAKTVIISALGYFIFPLDLIPDLAPVAGYADDIGALMSAIAIVSMYIDEQVKQKAKDKLKDWFGDYDSSEIDKIEI